jgi:DNA-binding NarL/FixJ family response regulator
LSGDQGRAGRAGALVAVADRSPVFALGLAAVVAQLGHEPLAGSTPGDVRDLLGKAPDLLVVDLRLLGADHESVGTARERGVPVVVCVPHDSLDEAMGVVEQGVAGLWDREGDAGELRRIVTGALTGSTRISAEVGGAVLERIAAASSSLHGMGGRLTPREREILSLMAEGAGNRMIAETLVISENTVRNHVRSVLEKMHARSRTEAVVRAVKAGLVRLS